MICLSVSNITDKVIEGLWWNPSITELRGQTDFQGWGCYSVLLFVEGFTKWFLVQVTPSGMDYQSFLTLSFPIADISLGFLLVGVLPGKFLKIYILMFFISDCLTWTLTQGWIEAKFLLSEFSLCSNMWLEYFSHFSNIWPSFSTGNLWDSNPFLNLHWKMSPLKWIWRG